MVRKKILIVDDEKCLVDSIVFILQKEGYETIAAYDGKEALEIIQENGPDLIVLDVMLPGLDGISICKTIRQKMIFVPVIMLTAKSEEIDRIVGLEVGADDYLAKPFSLKELAVRIKAIFRRQEYMNIQDMEFFTGNLFIDNRRKQLFQNKELVSLTPKEFDIIYTLMEHKGRVVSKEILFERVWGKDFIGDPKAMEVYVRRIRTKIEKNPSNPVYLITIKGKGYLIEDIPAEKNPQ